MTEQICYQYANSGIRLRPDLSEGSVDYIYKLVASYGEGQRCLHCNLYRSEQQGILQGIMENKKVVPVNTVLGTCPDDDESSLSASKIKNNCPKWDQDCGCHGPIMTRGAVAWAAGQAGVRSMKQLQYRKIQYNTVQYSRLHCGMLFSPSTGLYLFCFSPFCVVFFHHYFFLIRHNTCQKTITKGPDFFIDGYKEPAYVFHFSFLDLFVQFLLLCSHYTLFVYCYYYFHYFCAEY